MRRVALLFALVVAPRLAAAQLAASDTLRPPNTETLDLRVFRAVYEADSPAFETVMRQTNTASGRIFVGAVPVAAVAALVAGEEARPALRLALAEAGALTGTFALKRALRRPRPYAALTGVEPRASGHPSTFDPYAFPSGHAAASFALATSATLSYPEWYVAVPALSWATMTALARVWHGVHYPTDVAAGAALGVGSAVLVHVLFPSGEDGSDENAAPALVAFRVSL